MNSRRFMPDMGLSRTPVQPVSRTRSLAQGARPVLGADLNCSESRQAAVHPGSFAGTCFEACGLDFPGARFCFSDAATADAFRNRFGGEWLDLVATSAAADWDASFTMERINL
jgi:hypothetical protein